MKDILSEFNKLKKWYILGCLLCLLASFSVPTTKILIIGDSISIGYTPYVQDYFLDKAIVKHNPGNAQHTGTGLIKLKEWIGEEDWDIVQFNWDLWDLCYRHPNAKTQGNRDKINGKITYTLAEYTHNLDSLVRELKTLTDAKLVFVTTSYVPNKEAGRFKGDAKKYNKAAKGIMKKHDILINDLYKKSKTIHQKYGKGDQDVHFTKKGYAALGELISSFLDKEVLSLKNP